MPNPIPETNVIKKDWRRVDLHVALCYPNVYRTGMTGFTVQLLYALLNAREDVVCERCFLPINGEPARSIESNQPLRSFDIVAFSLQYEGDYINALRLLLESNIRLKQDERKPEDPLIIAGGPCTVENPEPLADFIDFFIIGELEPILDELTAQLKKCKQDKRKLPELADIPGVYVPTVPPPKIERVWVKNLDDSLCPLAQVVPDVEEKSPYMPIFGRVFTVEAVRGCGRGCRFCLIGFIGRPKREKSLKRVEEILIEGIRYTPVDKISLIGAGLTDHSKIEDLCELIVSNKLKISVPSLRAEAITEPLVNLLVKGEQRTITIAPEAGTQRLRNSINKGVYEETIIEAARTALLSGITNLKLYFIIGLPGETMEDIESITELARKIADVGFGSKSIRLSINPLIPKPHTPFQWVRLADVRYLHECMRRIKLKLAKDPRFQIRGIDPRHAQIQTLLSIGDRAVGKLLELATIYGGSFGAWRRALGESGVKLSDYVYQQRRLDEPLPWDHISVGLNKRFLISEFEKATHGLTTPPCEVECTQCGVCEVP